MKIFEIKLLSKDEKTMYTSIVPEIHVRNKIDTLLEMNEMTDIKSIGIVEIGDISDRYIQGYVNDVDHQFGITPIKLR